MTAAPLREAQQVAIHPFVRSSNPADDAGLENLWQASWTHTYRTSLGPTALAEMLKGLKESGIASMLPGNGEQGFCAVLHGGIIGSAILAERGRTSYLWGMYVHPDQQRKGLGSQLLAEIIKHIKNAQKLELRVLGSSLGALGFYEKHGFLASGREMTELLDKLSVEAIVMSASVEELRSRFR